MDADTFLEAFEDSPIIPFSDTVIVDDRRIHIIYTDQNKKDVLIFVHGSPGSWSAFIDYFKLPELLENFDIIAVDRPGYGASDYGIPEPSLQSQVAFIHQSLSLQKYNRKIWIGHSLGGPVIGRMAMDYPDKVDGLVMLAPSIDPDMEKYEWYRTWFKTKIIGAIMPTDFWVSNEEILPLKEELNKMLPLWQHITARTVVIHGTADKFVPVENAYFAKRMMKDSLVSLTILDDVNHFIPWSHQDLIVSEILKFKNGER